MLVFLAGVAFAQESRFQVGAGLGSTGTLEPGPLELSGSVAGRFDPNGATFRLSMLESTSSTALFPELTAQIGTRARQRQLAVGAGFETDVLRQSSSRTALWGVWCDASFGPWDDAGGVPFLLLDMLRLDLGFSFLGVDQLDHLVTRFGVSLGDEQWSWGVGLTLLGSPEDDTSLTTMLTLRHGFGVRKTDPPP